MLSQQPPTMYLFMEWLPENRKNPERFWIFVTQILTKRNKNRKNPRTKLRLPKAVHWGIFQERFRMPWCQAALSSSVQDSFVSFCVRKLFREDKLYALAFGCLFLVVLVFSSILRNLRGNFSAGQSQRSEVPDFASHFSASLHLKGKVKHVVFHFVNIKIWSELLSLWPKVSVENGDFQHCIHCSWQYLKCCFLWKMYAWASYELHIEHREEFYSISFFVHCRRVTTYLVFSGSSSFDLESIALLHCKHPMNPVDFISWYFFPNLRIPLQNRLKNHYWFIMGSILS